MPYIDKEDALAWMRMISQTGLKVQRPEDAQAITIAYDQVLRAAIGLPELSELIWKAIETANGITTAESLRNVTLDQIEANADDIVGLLLDLELPIAGILDELLRVPETIPQSSLAEVIKGSFGAKFLREFEEQIGAGKLDLSVPEDQRSYLDAFFKVVRHKALEGGEAGPQKIKEMNDGLYILKWKLELRLGRTEKEDPDYEVLSLFLQLVTNYPTLG